VVVLDAVFLVLLAASGAVGFALALSGYNKSKTEFDHPTDV
jgi:hypothetical protein